MMIRHEISVTLQLESGVVLKDVPIVFHTSPCSGGRTIWICHALTANSDPEEWWPGLAGPGLPIDTESNRVICVNIPGSPYGSVSPATINTDSGRPYLLDFPKITFRDITRALIAVRKALGINKIDLLIGSSTGGYQALEWAVTEPEIFRRCVFIATAPRVSPYFGATVEAQRMALEADPSFREAADIHGGEDGLRCARAQALISYRSFEGFRLTQSEPDDDVVFAGRAASYERHQGDKLVNRSFDAYSYWALCNAIDSHNIGRGRGGVKKALERIKAASTVVAISSDSIFPPSESREWSQWIGGAKYVEISSAFGHDGFLVEVAKISAILMQ